MPRRPTDPLLPHAVRRNADKLRPELGRADQERLAALLPLLRQDGRLPLGEVLDSLYKEQARDAALTALRQFRRRIADTAKDIGLTFTLETDGRTRTPPEERWCWFSGDSGAVEATAKMMAAEAAAGSGRVAQSVAEVTDLSDGKQIVRYFVSYAHHDRVQALKLLTPLQHLFASSADYIFEGWRDDAILPGDRWHEEIQRAIAQCHCGLLLVSPAFLASRYIRDNELPKFVLSNGATLDPNQRAIPVALKPVPIDKTLDLKGLEHRQLFLCVGVKSFTDCRGVPAQEAFALELFQCICAVLKRGLSPPPPCDPDSSTPSIPRRRPFDHILREHYEHHFSDFKLTKPEATLSSLDKDEIDPAHDNANIERVDALDALEAWVCNPQAQPYCALLGETGIGKTTTCLAFTQCLIQRRDGGDSAAPLPIYLDLRHLGDAATREPGLPEIIDTVLRKSWEGGEAPGAVVAEEVIRLVQQEGALAIFDGLDEVLVHLTPAAGQRFTRELFRLLPPALVRGRGKDGARIGRLLIACRTHYFRTLREQKTHFTAEDRDQVTAGDYRAFVLLPFTDAQIRDYLTQHLPDADIDRVLETISAVHNLPDMAQRPYTLKLIAEQLPAIERWKLEGRRVTGVLLYQRMVHSWLERDAGKHQLTPDHKQQLMEHFAAALWRSGRRTWSVSDIEQWLIDFLRARPEIAGHYEGVSRELLKEDLRTATFLVREGEDQFRFAHTSLLEFFLANALQRALLADQPEDWALPAVSRETLDFLGQLLLDLPEAERNTALATLRALRKTYRPEASHRWLEYTLHAHRHDYPMVTPAGADFAGADLRQVEILGQEDAPPLNLRGIRFTKARLEDARFTHVDLSDARFDAAALQRAEFLDARAENTCFRASRLEGAVFRQAVLTRADFGDCHTYRTQWLRCRLDEVQHLPAADGTRFVALCEPTEYNTASPKGPVWELFGKHLSGLTACTYAPDGRTLVSGSDDGTLRLWDAISYECRAVLRGHEDWVGACAYAPDGRTLLSGSEDGTLRLWDAASHECLAVLCGHEGGVRACAYAPDGRTLLSGSGDGTLRLWDAASRECLAVLWGYARGVRACAYAPDGRTLLSGSEDGTLWLWDAASHKCLAVLRGHERGVNACTYAPDGRTLLSGSGDGTLRLWDAASQECLAVLRGHARRVNACTYAPDGRTLLSGSEDGTLRLWDAASQECLAVLRGHETWVNACAYAPDGRTLVSGSDDGTLRLWDAASHKCLAVLRGHEVGVRACAYAPDGRTLVSGSDDGTLRLWDAVSQGCLAVLRGRENWVRACAYAPDGRTLLSGSGDGTLRLWDAASHECLAVLRGHARGVRACAYAPDGRTLLSGSWDGTLRLWDAASHECLAVLCGHGGGVRACAYAPDGRTLLSGSEDGTLRLWDAASHKCLAVLRGHARGVNACAYAPDGRTLLSGSGDGTLRLWDAASQECLAVLRGHENCVWACAYAPDGRTLLSGSGDGMRLWDAASHKCLAVLRGHERGVSACAYASDGRTLLSASDDGTLREWDLTRREPTGRVIALLSREGWAALDFKHNRVLHAGGDAWRWLGLKAPDPVTGAMTRWPAEVLGELPP